MCEKRLRPTAFPAFLSGDKPVLWDAGELHRWHKLGTNRLSFLKVQKEVLRISILSISNHITYKSFTFFCEAKHQSLQCCSFTLENPDSTKLKCSRGINWWPCLTDQNKSGRQVSPFAKSSDPQLHPYRLHSSLGWVRLPAPSPATSQLPHSASCLQLGSADSQAWRGPAG